MLTGCVKKQPTPLLRVVTGIQVEYQQDDRLLQRNYTSSDSIQAVLNYLRILKPFGPVEPEETTATVCRFTLRFSQGPDTVYLQQGNTYLSREDGSWDTIDSQRASLLYPLLLLLPSDE